MDDRFLRWSLAGLCALFLSACDGPPVAGTSDRLAPEDMGITKYVFRAKAANHFVVVFREDEFLDGRLARRVETITHTQGAPQEESVLLCQPGSPGVPTGYAVRGSAHTHLRATTEFKRSNFDTRPPRLELTFADEEDGRAVTRKFVYTMTLERHEDVLKRIPKLNTNLSYGWTYVDIQHPGMPEGKAP